MGKRILCSRDLKPACPWAARRSSNALQTGSGHAASTSILSRLTRWLIVGLAALTLLPSLAAVPIESYAVVHSYPHDPTAFTEGLFYRDGFLFESTGLNGRSSVRKVELQSGRVVQHVELPDEYFGEGLTDWGDELVNLTWQTRIGFVLDLKTFARKRSFEYLGEGWGLTHDGRVLYQSDGSSSLRVVDPVSLRELRRIQVTADGRPIARLNELEWVDGEIYANVWQTDFIARIDPATGQVRGWIDLTGLLASKGSTGAEVDVLNGIAYDPRGKRLFVTGKLWPLLFEIRRVPQSIMRRSAPPP